MTDTCVCCGLPKPVAAPPGPYCSTPCAEQQLRAIGMLLHSTPRPVLSVAEWHDLSSSYATDLEALGTLVTS
jgi:hypothetical protein